MAYWTRNLRTTMARDIGLEIPKHLEFSLRHFWSCIPISRITYQVTLNMAIQFSFWIFSWCRTGIFQDISKGQLFYVFNILLLTNFRKTQSPMHFREPAGCTIMSTILQTGISNRNESAEHAPIIIVALSILMEITNWSDANQNWSFFELDLTYWLSYTVPTIPNENMHIFGGNTLVLGLHLAVFRPFSHGYLWHYVPPFFNFTAQQ